jgi:hypothetical protein
MKTTVTFQDFKDAFAKMGRSTQFSTSALLIIFDDIEEYENSTGEDIELDVIAICCDIGEASTQEIARDYNIDGAEGETAADIVRDYLEHHSRILGEYEGEDDDGETVTFFVYQLF